MIWQRSVVAKEKVRTIEVNDYVELFKSWFGDNVDQKIIESAIIFWFKDVDCKSRNKVVSYFKEY